MFTKAIRNLTCFTNVFLFTLLLSVLCNTGQADPALPELGITSYGTLVDDVNLQTSSPAPSASDSGSVRTSSGAALRNQEAREQELISLFKESTGKNEAELKQSLGGVLDNEATKLTDDNSQRGVIVSKLHEYSLAKEEQEKQEKVAQIQSAAAFAQGYATAEDKNQYALNAANSYVSGKVDNYINNSLNAFHGVNAQITLGLSELKKMKVSGKILVPLYSKWSKLFPYMQTGVGYFNNNRKIAHLGVGMRWYPWASSEYELGDHMFGANAVFDYDITRHHRRMSLGLEYMNRYMLLSTNWYQRLSGWRDSYDFNSDLVEERPANGFDIRSKFFIPKRYTWGQMAATASVTHWFGSDISPFGSKSVDDLEDNPWIYAVGLQWQIVPAVSFEVREEITGKHQTNNYIGLNFSIPLDSRSLAHAFDPDYVNASSGLDLNSSRTMFIDRDYSMPLQYRAKPGKYEISYCGKVDTDTHCILIKDGLTRTHAGLEAKVTAAHESVKFSNNGSYLTSDGGQITVQVVESGVTHTTMTVTCGDSSADFEIDISTLTTLDLQFSADTILYNQTAIVTLQSESTDSAGLPVSWSATLGTLSDVDEELDEDGSASATFTPDLPTVALLMHELLADATGTTETASSSQAAYQGSVTAKVGDNEYTATITIQSYTNETELVVEDDLTEVEAGSITSVTYTELPAGTSVTWTINGDGKLSAKKDGSDADTTLTVKANSDGKAVVYFVADNVTEGSGKITASVESLGLADKTVEIAVYAFAPTATLSATEVEPGGTFTVTLSGLKPETEVTWTNAANDYATVAESTTTVDEEGSTTATYTISSDVYNTTITGIKAIYYQSESGTETIDIDEVTVKDYTPSFGDPVDNFSGADEITITLSGGLSGEAITWQITGDGVLSDEATEYDADGKATAKLTGKDPYTTEIVVTTNSMGKTQTYTQAFASWTVAFENFTNTHPVTGASATNTMAYNTAQNISLSGGKPETEISVVSDNANVTLSTDHCTVAADGSCTVTVAAITDYSVTSFNLTATYNKNSAETETVTMAVSLFDYTLSFGSAISNFSGNDEGELTLSGGQDGAAVAFSVVSGDGEIVSSDATFDSNGQAKVTIRGKSPYTTAIIVKAEALGKTALLEQPFDTWLVSINDFQTTNATTGEGAANTMDYETSQEISFAGGMPDTEISVATDNAAVTLSTASCTVSSAGTCNVTIAGITDYSVTNFTLTATYHKNSAETATVSLLISLYSYAISFGDASVSFSGDDTYEAVLSGGRSGSAVGFTKVSGDGTITAQSSTFDATGQATVTVKGASPYTEQLVIRASGMGMEAIFTQPYQNWTGELQDFTGTKATTGATAANTMDYNTAQAVQFQGGMPNSTVTFATDNANVTLAASSCTLDSSGNCTVTVNAITNYEVTGFNLTATYPKNSAQTDTSTLAISLFGYTLTMESTPDAVFTGNDTRQVVVSGGQSGAAVAFAVTGDGTLTVSPTTFASDGTATATVQGKSPYTSDIVVTVSGMGQEVSLTQPLTNYTLAFAEGTTLSYALSNTVNLSDGMPNTTVSLSATNGVTVSSSCTLDSNGACNITVGPLTDRNVTTTTVTASYSKNSAETVEITKSYSFAEPVTYTPQGEGTVQSSPRAITFVGTTTNSTFALTADTANSNTVTWACGTDGTPSEVVNFSASTSASAKCTWTSAGTKTVTATITGLTFTWYAAVSNHYSKSSGDESLTLGGGSSISGDYVIAATGANSNEVTWDCGTDGTPSEVVNFGNNTSASAKCTWTSAGTKTVTATVADDSGTDTELSWEVEVASWAGAALTWSDVITGDTYGSQTGASASNQYRVAQSSKSNGYYIISEEDYQNKADKYIFVAAAVLSGSGSSDGAEWGGYNTSSGSAATGSAVGTSAANTDVLIAANLTPNTASHVIAAQWVRNSGSYKGSGNPSCPTEFNGTESTGKCDLPSPNTLYTIWQVRNSLPQISGASGASNSWPRGYTNTRVWSSRYYTTHNACSVASNGDIYGGHYKNYLLGVVAVKEIGY